MTQQQKRRMDEVIGTLDLTDAEIIRSRAYNWCGGGFIPLSTLLYQMGGRPSVDPYGWRNERIWKAIADAETAGFIRKVEGICGTEIHAGRAALGAKS